MNFNFILSLTLILTSFCAHAQTPVTPTSQAIETTQSNTAPQVGQVSSTKNQTIVISSGAIEGVYYPVAGAICRLVNKDRKLLKIRCAVEASNGSIYNIESLRRGEIEFAIIQSDWEEHAYNGTALFAEAGRAEKLRHVFSLHNESITIVVGKNSNINNFNDLKGHSINIGGEGSGIKATMNDIMKAKGWTNKDFKSISTLKYAEQPSALCNGSIDAMIIATGHPSGLIEEVTRLCPTKIIEINDDVIQKFVLGNPEFAYTNIPGGLYNGINTDVKTIGLKASLVSTSDIPVETVYRITKVVFENLSSFKALHPVLNYLDPVKMATEGQTAPYHDGAVKYFKEAGLLGANKNE